MIISAIPNINYATESRLSQTRLTKLVSLNNTKASFTTLSNMDKFFTANDVVIVNDSAVLPGSFQAIHVPSNLDVELRLVRFLGSDINDFTTWQALVYGKGDWHTPTENRLPPPSLCIGDLILSNDLVAEIVSFSDLSPRLITIKFTETDSNSLLSKIYTNGKLIQYSYLKNELDLWDHQTIFSSYPVSVEPSSSVFQLNWELMMNLKAKGVTIIPITHAISISNTGISDIDKKLPLSERYWISASSCDLLNEALDENKSFIAFGTSVTRALESSISADHRFRAGSKNVDLVIDKEYNLKVTDGILTGMHMINESHINLLQAFLSLDKISTAYDQAINKGFLWHEYGDSMLIKSF